MNLAEACTHMPKRKRPKQKMDEWVHARCTPNLKGRLNAYLDEQPEKSEGDIVRDALREYLDRRQIPDKPQGGSN